jgi:hypothetical protein
LAAHESIGLLQILSLLLILTGVYIAGLKTKKEKANPVN